MLKQPGHLTSMKKLHAKQANGTTAPSVLQWVAPGFSSHTLRTTRLRSPFSKYRFDSISPQQNQLASPADSCLKPAVSLQGSDEISNSTQQPKNSPLHNRALPETLLRAAMLLPKNAVSPILLLAMLGAQIYQIAAARAAARCAPVWALYKALQLVHPLLLSGGGVQEVARHGGWGGRAADTRSPCTLR
eukprot:TRINITY_DN16861_c0_g1_i6.p1 TRINITY_DN16861_c0_g1~~TRINITY_DN16861_c0_g1_i6.p1  ORF type:complete len:189 (+),score=11.83 TRINITY_DN16861_c0_g1_i6:1257-1823(+)